MLFKKMFYVLGIAALSLSFLLIAVPSVQAEAPVGSLGIQASLQGGQTEIALPYVVSPELVFEPYFSVTHVSDVGTDYGLGLLLRFNISNGQAVPYWGLRGGAQLFDPSNGDGIIDLVLGPVVGGEYFLSDNFSLGVEAQINYTISDENSSRFGNPDGKSLNTATTVNAAFYF